MTGVKARVKQLVVDNEADGGAGAEGARAPSITILGVGNTLMGDDGVGVFVVEGLAEQLSAPTSSVDRR